MDFLKELTSQVTTQVTAGAKESAIATLNDKEFKKAVSGFVTDFVNEHKVIIIVVFGSMFLLGTMGAINIVSNYKMNQRRK